MEGNANKDASVDSIILRKRKEVIDLDVINAILTYVEIAWIIIILPKGVLFFKLNFMLEKELSFLFYIIEIIHIISFIWV